MKALSIDIGGSYIKYAIMNERLEMLEKGKIKTPKEGRSELVEALTGLYRVHSEAEIISVSLPGIIDYRSGYIYMGGAIRYNDGFNLKEALSEQCPGVKIVLNNDAKCAAAAEAASGALKGIDEGIVLLFGTMVGGGLIMGGKVRHGVHFSAGEVSYIITDRAANPEPSTIFGNRCGTPWLCGEYARLKGIPAEGIEGEAIFEAINGNDPCGIEALSAYTKNIAVQIFNLQTVFDARRFAIGGGISAQPVFIESIQRQVQEMYSASPYYSPMPEIVACRYGNDANLIGALQFALEA